MSRLVPAVLAVLALSCGVSEVDLGGDADATDTTVQDVRRNDPCATVRCASGTRCVAKGRQASCLADDTTACKQDSDCRLNDNYCDGCACDALATSAPAPTCSGTLVQCFAQPCGNKVAVCKAGTCTVADAPTTGGEPCGAKTCGSGQVCCNASCGICTAPGMFCTQQACL